jgi:hypothetical protein
MRPSRRGFPQDHYKKRKANLRSSIVSCTDSDFKWELQIRLAHTFTYFANFGVLTTHCFESAILFKLMRCICLWRHYACARAVWCSWCTLEWLGYPYVLVIARAIKVERGSVWRVAISQPRYLARSQWQSCGCSTHDTLGSVAAPLVME